MFTPNNVYRWEDIRIRVLWVNPEVLFWIDIDRGNALPCAAQTDEFKHLAAKGEIESIRDPHINYSLNSPAKGSKAEAVLEGAWQTIHKALHTGPDIYQRNLRGILISEAQKNSSATKQTIYRWLRRYWQLGMCKNALSGHYKSCGGKGKSKNLTDKKNGRRRTSTDGEGVVVTEDIKSIFRVAIEKCLLNEEQFSQDYAYNQVLLAFGVKLPCTPEALINVPTLRQFSYFYKTQYDPIEINKKRVGMVNYLKEFRPIINTSTEEAPGPGFLYQIDATIADVYLVSEKNREKIIGRPTMYFVADVFSRAITGMYIGLENASWVSAMSALTNALTDKVEYCRSYGIDITPDMWPMHGLPENIIGDRGEMMSRHVEVLSQAFNIDIQNTAPYRADLKGIVERYFRTIQAKMKPFVEGYVTKQTIGKKRNGKDYRLDATLTLKEFTQMIIRIVLFYNNEHAIKTYDPDESLPDNLPYNPATLWNWGIEYRTGLLRRPEPELVKINLLPHTQATITEHGVKLFGCYYSCREALELGWFEGNYSGNKKITVGYDLHNTDTIYIRYSENFSDYFTANLTSRSRAYKGITFWELWVIQKNKRRVAAKENVKARAGSINLSDALDTIAENAKAKKNPSTSSKAQKTTGIAEAKIAERQYERSKKTPHINTNESSSENVIEITSQIKQRKTFLIRTNPKLSRVSIIARA